MAPSKQEPGVFGYRIEEMNYRVNFLVIRIYPVVHFLCVMPNRS
jgi:hypothetical protein